MVKKESSVYLFIGQDALSKDARLKKLKEEFLSPHTQYFNLDVLYAKELDLKDLQERLLCLPLRAKKRIVIIKDSQNLKKDIKEFIIQYVKKPFAEIILVLDINKYLPQDEFIRQINRYSQVCRFKEDAYLDTFALGRAIDSKKSNYALWVLNQLLRNGEKPERILGGLRYSWENSIADVFQTKKKLRLLLGCDIDIKTGRLRADFALERLVVSLCSFAKPSG
jgi:DNA polymerase III delta subunit